MDEDKAIRAAKLTLGGMLEKKRAKSAVERAQGQIAPSKYLPGVPRAVHAAGGYVPQASLPVSRVAIANPVSYGQQPTAIDALSSLASIGSTVKGFSDTVEGEEAPTGGGHHPNDGHDHSNMSEAALAAWGKLTDAYGQPLTVTSAYRDPKRNESVGGAGNSQHMHGNAYDIDTSGMSYEDRLALADMAWNSGFRGVGFYDNSLHFDVGDPRSWGPSYSRDSIPEWALPWAQERYGYADGGPVTSNDNFRNWFGNSVTHTDGEPHVFYTGTSKDKDFTSFNVGRHGAWFTRDPEVASSYAEQNDSQGYKRDGWNMVKTNTASRVIPAYVRAENPYTGELPPEVMRDNYKAAQSDWFDSLRAKGHDAWIPASQNGNLLVALKEPHQIKSIYNSGKFDPKQKHMNKADGGSVGVPGKTVKAYKLFRRKGDQLYPLFVNAEKPVPMGEWIDAEEGPQGKAQGKVKSKLGDLAYRPGWHAGDLPVATHIGGKSSPDLKAPDYRPDNHVWAEVEMPNDVDWQSEANARAKVNKAGQPILNTAHITDQLPKGGFYRYKTNPNMTGNWLIGGSMKVNRVLSDEEVKTINDQAGTADLPRRSGGFAAGGAAMFEGMHEDLTNEDGTPKELWHGTPGEGFEAFDDAKLGSTRDYGFYGRGHYLTPDRDVAEEYTTNEYENPGTVMGPLHAALKNPYIWDTSDAGSHRTLRDLQSMGIMKGQGKLEPWDNLQRHHIDPFMREMKNRGHDGVLVKGDSGLSEVVVFKPTAIKHRDAEVFDPNDPRIMRAGGGRTLYSRAAEIIRGLPQEKGTVDQYIAAAKARGAKPSELEHAGRPEGDKITRDEMAKHFESRLPKLKIEQYGENPSRLTRDEDKRRIELQNRDQLGRGEPLTPEEKTEQERLNRRLMSSPNVMTHNEDESGEEQAIEPEYSAYKLPGGQNYRERLISLQRPKDPREPLEDRLKKLTQTQNAWPEGHPARDRFDSEINEIKGKLETMPQRKEPATYQSSHWAGHPNVLAHIRMQDRTLGEDRDSVRPIAEKLATGLGIGIRDLASGAASVGIQNKIITPQEAASLSRLMGWRNGYDQAPGIGKRVLHVEELQSDWGQEGRDKGFADTENPYEVFNKKTKEVISRHPSYSAAWDAYRAIPEDQAADLDTGKSTGPSTAPYVTNTQHWTDLALKHVLQEAAHGNYDGIVFSPGQAQADRYGLEKQVDSIKYWPEDRTLSALQGNSTRIAKQDIGPEDLPSLIGKELSEKLLHPDSVRKSEYDGSTYHMLQGDQMKVGGSGMKSYYDQIVPKSVMRLAQQHDPEAKAAGPVDLGGGYSGFHLPMTDTLKNSIIDKGFSAFKRGGNVDKALAITRSFTKDGRAATMQLKAKGD